VLSGNRIAILASDGNAYVKEGGLSATWTRQSSRVTQIGLS
jgi:hypothetical protein